jgi:hypothetical protein
MALPPRSATLENTPAEALPVRKEHILGVDITRIMTERSIIVNWYEGKRSFE